MQHLTVRSSRRRTVNIKKSRNHAHDLGRPYGNLSARSSHYQYHPWWCHFPSSICPSPRTLQAAYSLRRRRTTRCRAFRRLRFINALRLFGVLYSAQLYCRRTDSNARSWQDSVDVLIPAHEPLVLPETSRSIRAGVYCSQALTSALCSANQLASHYRHAVITIALRVLCRNLRTCMGGPMWSSGWKLIGDRAGNNKTQAVKWQRHRRKGRVSTFNAVCTSDVFWNENEKKNEKCSHTCRWTSCKLFRCFVSQYLTALKHQFGTHLQ